MKQHLQLIAYFILMLCLPLCVSAMERPEPLAKEQAERKKLEQYRKEFYFVPSVSPERAEAYCNQLCRHQMGFAKAAKYYSIHKDDEKIKPLESFLKRFSTEIISRANFMRHPKLREYEYGNECEQAIKGIEMSECFLYYLKTGEVGEGQLTREQWHQCWKKIDMLKVDDKKISSQEKKEQT